MNESKQSELSDELVIGTIGILLSVGLMKAHEAFDFFDKIDLFRIYNGTLLIRGRELLAVFLFAALYTLFILGTGFALAIISKRSRMNSSILPVLIGALVAMHACSFFASYSHAMHKYGELARGASAVVWELGP